ncbi:MAG: 50S ribosomal protein L35 [Candidatus Terrybacteria bacterium CG10_big_fil_rev_8_21_14_0_10_41_10]|uniref:50S ribosomal protein L35 n=1 Tax=Candidatus Terrybacteria bacterium CG10_big_fil_rev_8_21_14_0_10_41_10 TaxID=1975026 RepID=A0A2M8LAD0_9BACT|nr:MAG: 50S ribosomal protein L35 [Candidatus Terrybacteria bacterium CG10_big_fil_rev_8_21_14_0_10_41_10]
MKMKFKTNKSYSKRLKLTKKGKVISRKSGQNHFNAKESRSKQLAKKKTRSFTLSSKNISRFLPSN